MRKKLRTTFLRYFFPFLLMDDVLVFQLIHFHDVVPVELRRRVTDLHRDCHWLFGEKSSSASRGRNE